MMPPATILVLIHAQQQDKPGYRIKLANTGISTTHNKLC